MRTKTKRLTAAAVCALTAGVLLGILQAAPPPPRPRRPIRLRPGRPRVVRRARPVLARRRGLRVVYRGGSRVVVGPTGTIVRRVPPPVVVKSVTDLKPVPIKSASTGTSYKVRRISSGCTAVLEMDGKDVPVRLIGVDPVAQGEQGDAVDAVKDLLAGEYVSVEYDPAAGDQDEEGNTLVYLYRAPDGLFVNLELVRRGKALAATDYDYKHRETFEFYEGKAQADGKGVWKAAPAVTTQPAEGTG